MTAANVQQCASEEWQSPLQAVEYGNPVMVNMHAPFSKGNIQEFRRKIWSHDSFRRLWSNRAIELVETTLNRILNSIVEGASVASAIRAKSP